jgi:hypothetical protein
MDDPGGFFIIHRYYRASANPAIEISWIESQAGG